jgi:hypothetical protein
MVNERFVAFVMPSEVERPESLAASRVGAPRPVTAPAGARPPAATVVDTAATIERIVRLRRDRNKDIRLPLQW